MTGVSSELRIRKDFMIVTAALVRAVGGANEALVWARIDFRIQGHPEAHIDADGVTWWAASQEQLSEETGLSRDQVQRALKRMLDDGTIEAAKHRLQGGYDQRKSYRTVVVDEPEGPRAMHCAKSRNGTRESAQSTYTQEESLTTFEKEEARTTNRPQPPKPPSPYSADFERFWKEYPIHLDKANAWKSWLKVVPFSDVEAIVAGAIRYRNDPERDPGHTKWAQGWLAARRWEDEEPIPAARGQQRQLRGAERLMARSQELERMEHNEYADMLKGIES